MPLRVFVIAPSSLLTDHRPHGDGLVGFGFIRELGARGHQLHVAAGRVDLLETLPPNVHVHELGGPHEGGRAARPRFMWRLRRLYGRLQATPFDVVHQLTPVEAGVSLALVGARAPLVLGPYVPDWPPSGEGADSVVSPTAMRLKRVLRAAQQRSATTLLLSTAAAASQLERRGRGQVRELPFGIDERTWVPAPSGGTGNDVLFLANLQVRKGIHVLLEAFERLGARLPEARLTVAGAGPELDAVRDRIRSSPSLERVGLVGQLERDQVLATMQACDVYCLPSYGEPFGMSALEAMACGKPVVATEAGGLGRLVPDRGGRKVPPGDPVALAEALHDVLATPGLSHEMGAHNRAVVEERYAWSRVVDRLEETYLEAVAGAGRRAYAAAMPPREEPTRRHAPLTERIVARAQRIARRHRLHVLTESRESPVARMPAPDSDVWRRQSSLPGVAFDLQAQLRFVESSLGPHLAEFGSAVRSPTTGRAFPLWNGYYQAGDAEFLYAIVRHFRPRRILELGSGFSTFVTAAAAARNAQEGSPVELTAVDPSPRAELSAGIEGLSMIERRDSQELPLERFDALGPNDILFVDSSHAVKLGGELHWLVLEVLPRLNEQVLVHFHDVFLPHEYPRELFELWPYFNEQYLVQAFLVGNADYEVILAAAALVEGHPERVRQLVPSLSEGPDRLPWSPYVPSAFWLRRARKS